MKNARHEQILQLIGIYDIETQEELAEKLNEKGFAVTQATVSRDIRQLQLRKVNGSDGKSHYTLGGGSHVDLSRKYKRVLQDAFVSADHAGNIIVIHTVSRSCYLGRLCHEYDSIKVQSRNGSGNLCGYRLR